MLTRLRQVQPALWLIMLAVVGVAFLAWHRWAQNDEDESWQDPMYAPPAPVMAELPLCPGLHGEGRQMACGPAFRRRSYAPDLISADFSLIGEF